MFVCPSVLKVSSFLYQNSKFINERFDFNMKVEIGDFNFIFMLRTHLYNLKLPAIESFCRHNFLFKKDLIQKIKSFSLF